MGTRMPGRASHARRRPGGSRQNPMPSSVRVHAGRMRRAEPLSIVPSFFALSFLTRPASPSPLFALLALNWLPLLPLLASQIVFLSVAWDTSRRAFHQMTQIECPRCRGTRLLTCPHCHGTAAVRAAPGSLRARDGFVNSDEDVYPCEWCGPPSQAEEDMSAEMDEDSDQTGLLATVASGRFPMRPSNSGPLSGTIPCTRCKGHGVLRAPGIGFMRVLDQLPRWREVEASRTGTYWQGVRDRVAHRKRLYLEFPRSIDRHTEGRQSVVDRDYSDPPPQPEDAPASVEFRPGGYYAVDPSRPTLFKYAQDWIGFQDDLVKDLDREGPAAFYQDI